MMCVDVGQMFVLFGNLTLMLLTVGLFLATIRLGRS